MPRRPDLKFNLTVEDKTARAIRAAEKRIKKLDKAVGSVSKGFVGMSSAFGAGLALKEIARAGLELDKITRTLGVATGSAEAAADEFRFVSSEAQRLGIGLRSAAVSFAQLSAAARGTSLQGKGARDIFTAIAESSRVMGLSVEQQRGSFRAIEQMISKGTVQAEELRGQLGERLPGAFQISARALGITTMELNRMLQRGEVLAEDLLPKLAKQLRKELGDQVLVASEDAAAGFQRFENAAFTLSANIAKSGLMDVMADIAESMSDVFGGKPAERRRAEILREIEHYEMLGAQGVHTASQLATLKKELLFINRQILDAADAQNFNDFIESLKIDENTLTENAIGIWDTYQADIKKIEENKDRIAARYAKAFETVEQKIQRQLSEFNLVAGRFEDADRIRDEIKSQLFEGLEEFDLGDLPQRRIAEPMKDAMDEINVYADQAARNMQDAFADFLFDPFEDGLEGMVRGFLDAIRRMLANQLAQQLFSAIGNVSSGGTNANDPGGHIGKGLSSLFPGKALGGSVDSSKPYIVGERGPELFVPNTSGSIVPNSKMGASVNVNNNITVNGADPAHTVELLTPLLEQNRQQTKAELLELHRNKRVFG